MAASGGEGRGGEKREWGGGREAAAPQRHDDRVDVVKRGDGGVIAVADCEDLLLCVKTCYGKTWGSHRPADSFMRPGEATGRGPGAAAEVRRRGVKTPKV